METRHIDKNNGEVNELFYISSELTQEQIDNIFNIILDNEGKLPEVKQEPKKPTIITYSIFRRKKK